MVDKRKKKEIEFKKNLIIDAAQKIFFDKGFDNATMVDIAEKAGYSKGAIYSYFDSKNEICFNIVNNYYERIYDLIKQIRKRKLTALEKLIKIKEEFIANFVNDSDFVKIFNSFKHHKHLCKQTTKEIKKNNLLNSKIYDLVKEVISEGVKDESLKPNLDKHKLSRIFWNPESCLICELKSKDVNKYDYLYDLVIESIKNKSKQ